LRRNKKEYGDFKKDKGFRRNRLLPPEEQFWDDAMVEGD